MKFLFETLCWNGFYEIISTNRSCEVIIRWYFMCKKIWGWSSSILSWALLLLCGAQYLYFPLKIFKMLEVVAILTFALFLSYFKPMADPKNQLWGEGKRGHHWKFWKLMSFFCSSSWKCSKISYLEGRERPIHKFP